MINAEKKLRILESRRLIKKLKIETRTNEKTAYSFIFKRKKRELIEYCGRNGFVENFTPKEVKTEKLDVIYARRFYFADNEKDYENLCIMKTKSTFSGFLPYLKENGLIIGLNKDTIEMLQTNLCIPKIDERWLKPTKKIALEDLGLKIETEFVIKKVKHMGSKRDYKKILTLTPTNIILWRHLGKVASEIRQTLNKKLSPNS
jgi:hypothetical protein